MNCAQKFYDFSVAKVLHFKTCLLFFKSHNLLAQNDET
jgi:hypothetical protein